MFSHCFTVFAQDLVAVATDWGWGGIVNVIQRHTGEGEEHALGWGDGERGLGRDSDFNYGKLLVIVHIIM